MSPLDRRRFLKVASGLVVGAAVAPQLLIPDRRFWPGFSAARERDPMLIARMAIQAEVDRQSLLGLPVKVGWVDNAGEGLLEDLPGPIAIQSSFDLVRPQMRVTFPLPEGAIGARIYVPSYRRNRYGQMVEDYHLLGNFTAEQIQQMRYGELARDLHNEQMLERDVKWAADEDALGFIDRVGNA